MGNLDLKFEKKKKPTSHCYNEIIEGQLQGS